MIRLILQIKCLYSTKNLAILKEKYNLQICFKQKSLVFLKQHCLVSKNLSNRIVIRGGYRCSYKQLKYFYITFLRDNFLKNSIKKNKLLIQTYDINYFLDAYEQSHYGFNDLDRVLIWRAIQINSIFKLIQTEKRKRKKYIYTSRLQFLPPYKRILVVWRWLSVLIRAYTIKDKAWKVAYLPSLENFLIAQAPYHIITDLKLQIYKLKLLRTV